MSESHQQTPHHNRSPLASRQASGAHSTSSRRVTPSSQFPVHDDGSDALANGGSGIKVVGKENADPGLEETDFLEGISDLFGKVSDQRKKAKQYHLDDVTAAQNAFDADKDAADAAAANAGASMPVTRQVIQLTQRKEVTSCFFQYRSRLICQRLKLSPTNHRIAS